MTQELLTLLTVLSLNFRSLTALKNPMAAVLPSPRSQKAADGALCSDLPLHSRGCGTFSQVFLLLNN